MGIINFFVESLKNLKTIGAVVPCFLVSVRKMIDPIDFSKAETIVELGGGTGAVTEEKILEAVRGVLRSRGRYVQLQYSLVSKNRIKQRFDNVRVDFTPFNFPPAFFYICER